MSEEQKKPAIVINKDDAIRNLHAFYQSLRIAKGENSGMKVNINLSSENIDKLKETLAKLTSLKKYGDIEVNVNLLSPKFDPWTGKIIVPHKH